MNLTATLRNSDSRSFPIKPPIHFRIILILSIVVSSFLVQGCSSFYCTRFVCQEGDGAIVVRFGDSVRKESLFDLKADPNLTYTADVGELNAEPFVEIHNRDHELLSMKGGERRSGDDLLNDLEKRLTKILSKPDPLGPFVTLSTENPWDDSKCRAYLDRALNIVKEFNSKK